jgi:hypothetical protein
MATTKELYEQYIKLEKENKSLRNTLVIIRKELLDAKHDGRILSIYEEGIIVAINNVLKASK